MFFFFGVNKYDIGLALVNQKAEVDFTKDKISSEKTVKEYIIECTDLFSNEGKTSLKNSKYIDKDSIKILDKRITFTLCSEKELSAPGKSLKQLSNYLLKEPYFEQLKVNGKLFKTYTTVDVEDEESGETQSIDVTNAIDDAELVKALVDYLMEPQQPYTKERHDKRVAVDKMKVLAIQSGLLKYKE